MSVVQILYSLTLGPESYVAMFAISTDCVCVGDFILYGTSNVVHQLIESRPRASIPGCMSSFTQHVTKIARTCFCIFLVCFPILSQEFSGCGK